MFDFESLKEFYPPRGYEYTKLDRDRLRPLAESLCLIAGEPYFERDPDLPDHWENYLPDAYALFAMYGGEDGAAGKMSFIKRADAVNTPLIHPYLIDCAKEAVGLLAVAGVALGIVLTIIYTLSF